MPRWYVPTMSQAAARTVRPQTKVLVPFWPRAGAPTSRETAREAGPMARKTFTLTVLGVVAVGLYGATLLRFGVMMGGGQ